SKNNVLAIRSLKELIEKFPLEPQAYEALDFLTGLLEVPDSKEPALSALKDIIKSLGRSNPLAIEAQFRLARSFFEDKNYSKVTEMLERIISELMESTRFADANYYLAESYYQLSEFNKAELAYKRFIDNFPEDKRAIIAIFHLGSAQFKGETFAEAAETFEKLVQNYPDCEYSAGAMYNAILAYRKLRKWEKAASTLQMYQEKYPDAAKSSGMDIELATIYEEQNQYLKAIEILQAIRNKMDRGTETWGEITFRIAENYMAIEEEEKGIGEYQKLVSINNPTLGGWMLNAMIKMGEYYEKNGDMQKALSLYEELCKKSEAMAKKPAWLKAIKSRIEAIRAEIKSQ
ncbi:MAG: tetratricopeptide repeat protein, partial [bacterium]